MAEAEGLKLDFASPDVRGAHYLETFPYKQDFNDQASDFERQAIRTETDEFSAVCPFSGLPDVARLIIEYVPEKDRCVELKSLKYYTTSFRNIGIYQEHVTRLIWEDLSKHVGTKLVITTVYNRRGGFDTICEFGSLDRR